jgi:hypothetical protein
METAEELRANANMNAALWRGVESNSNERFHVLPAVTVECDTLGQGLPSLGIDFKRYFTIRTDELYARLEVEARRRCYLHSAYGDHLSVRFSYFQMRVALPEEYSP